MKEYFNEPGYLADRNSIRIDWNRINKFIEKLKYDNQVIYWDILYNGLAGKFNPHEAYCMRYAELNNRNWNSVDTRNEIRRMFAGYFPHEYQYHFPQKFVTLHDDGSFSYNQQAVDEYCKSENTYTFDDKEEKAVNDIIKSINVLGIAPALLHKCFVPVNGTLTPQWKTIRMYMKLK